MLPPSLRGLIRLQRALTQTQQKFRAVPRTGSARETGWLNIKGRIVVQIPCLVPSISKK